MTLDEMGKVNLHPNIVIPFRPKLFTAEGLATEQQVHRSGRGASYGDLGPYAGANLMVEVGEMMTAGPERRVTGPRRRALTLVAGLTAESPVPVVDPAVLRELKERIRAVLMTRIDPSVAGRIPRATIAARSRRSWSARSRPKIGFNSTNSRRPRSPPTSATT